MKTIVSRKILSVIYRLLITICLVMSLLGNSHELRAEKGEAEVVEYLRLEVPAETRDAWLNAERQSWGPWLSRQKGFLGREMFWDKDREEAWLLISWSSRKYWKAISQKDLEAVQDEFEKLSREGTGKSTGNPFPLQYEGELVPQV